MNKVAIENDGTKVRILLVGNDGDVSYRDLPKGIIGIEKLKTYETLNQSAN